MSGGQRLLDEASARFDRINRVVDRSGGLESQSITAFERDKKKTALRAPPMEAVKTIASIVCCCSCAFVWQLHLSILLLEGPPIDSVHHCVFV